MYKETKGLITRGINQVVQQTLDEAHSATQVSGLGPDAGDLIGRMKPHCIQIDADLAYSPTPPHTWTDWVIQYIMIKIAPNIWKVVPHGLGVAILLFAR